MQTQAERSQTEHALVTAVRKKNFDKLYELIAVQGRDVNHLSHGYSALHWAAKDNDVDAIDLLCGRLGADVNVRDACGHTPLHLAAYAGSEEAVRALCGGHRANVHAVNRDDETALHCAAFAGFKYIMTYLLMVGADMGATTGYGMSVLDIADPTSAYVLREVHQKLETEKIKRQASTRRNSSVFSMVFGEDGAPPSSPHPAGAVESAPDFYHPGIGDRSDPQTSSSSTGHIPVSVNSPSTLAPPGSGASPAPSPRRRRGGTAGALMETSAAEDSNDSFINSVIGHALGLKSSSTARLNIVAAENVVGYDRPALASSTPLPRHATARSQASAKSSISRSATMTNTLPHPDEAPSMHPRPTKNARKASTDTRPTSKESSMQQKEEGADSGDSESSGTESTSAQNKAVSRTRRLRGSQQSPLARRLLTKHPKG